MISAQAASVQVSQPVAVQNEPGTKLPAQVTLAKVLSRSDSGTSLPAQVKIAQPVQMPGAPHVAAVPRVYRQTMSVDAAPASFAGGIGAFSHLRSICLEFPYEKLAAATGGFHPSRLLGCGNAGSVYRAEMADGSPAAVKVIDLAKHNDAAITGFEDEITILSKFRHPNLVVLMGWSQRDTRRFLVYEFLGGGDVSQRLEKAKMPGGHPFPWQERLAVALDAATGLSYLHNATPRAFHRDIKSANILMSRAGAKMADFGISCVTKQIPGPGTADLAMRCKTTCGTPGYACPTYIQTGVITEGSEVYSFGIVLLELLLNRGSSHWRLSTGSEVPNIGCGAAGFARQRHAASHERFGRHSSLASSCCRGARCSCP